MSATLGCMTLQEILKQHGINSYRELKERAGLKSRQQAHALWTGEAGVGKAMVKRLHERLGIPVADLIQVDPVPYTKPRKRQGRPKPSQEQHSPDE